MLVRSRTALRPHLPLQPRIIMLPPRMDPAAAVVVATRMDPAAAVVVATRMDLGTTTATATANHMVLATAAAAMVRATTTAMLEVRPCCRREIQMLR